MEIMNDGARIRKFAGSDWEIRALKPGTQLLIAQEAIAIAKAIKAREGRDYWIELHDAVKYVFRTLNLQDSGWV